MFPHLLSLCARGKGGNGGMVGSEAMSGMVEEKVSFVLVAEGFPGV